MNTHTQPSPCRSELTPDTRPTWPGEAWPSELGALESSVPTLIRQSVLNAIHTHGSERTDVEVCGVLIGNGYHDQGRLYVRIEGAIRGAHAESHLAQVTFTSATWNHIYDELERDWPGRSILGWYHTHPGFGIFLSEMDHFIHRGFFSAPEQVALVYDPVSGAEGLFVWNAGEPERTAWVVEPDVAAEVPSPATSNQAPKTILKIELEPSSPAAHAGRKRFLFAAALLAISLVLATLVAWKFGPVWRPQPKPAPPIQRDVIQLPPPEGVNAEQAPQATEPQPADEAREDLPRGPEPQLSEQETKGNPAAEVAIPEVEGPPHE